MSRFNCRRVVYSLVLTLSPMTQARATMPTLTPKPKPTSISACERWAGRQGEDAIYIWGTQQTGGSSKPVAITRLTAFCLGGKKPDIVGFGSSIGFNDAYCAKHGDAPICRNR